MSSKCSQPLDLGSSVVYGFDDHTSRAGSDADLLDTKVNEMESDFVLKVGKGALFSRRWRWKGGEEGQTGIVESKVPAPAIQTSSHTIFIALNVRSSSPFSTRFPGWTSIRSTLAFIGAGTSPGLEGFAFECASPTTAELCERSRVSRVLANRLNFGYYGELCAPKLCIGQNFLVGTGPETA